MSQSDNDELSDEFASSKKEPVSRKQKFNKARLSLTKVQDRCPDGISRYGRARKPKYDCDDFLPTDAVLGKSPKSPKKDKKKFSQLILPVSPIPINDDVFSDVAYIKDHSSSILDKSVGALSESSPGEEDERPPLDHTINSSLESSSQEEVVTDFEPGDLIWGRVGHHPFWPCIIINDPEKNIYFKTTGHGRLLYHVLFYGDNGKRSWVPLSLVLRFLGLQDFESQTAAITPEMKKKDPKWFSGFFVKSNQKQKWEVAVTEAEAAMPMTRDERVDAFLRTFPDKHHKVAKKIRDGDMHESQTDKESTSKDTSPDKLSKQSISRLKKGSGNSSVDSPPWEKRKRGRPRKSVTTPVRSDIALKLASSESFNSSLKLKQSTGADSSSDAMESSFQDEDDDLDEEDRDIRFADFILKDKEAAETGWKCFRTWYIFHVLGHCSDISSEVIDTIVLQEWNASSIREKAAWVPVDLRDPIIAREEKRKTALEEARRDGSQSSDEEKDDDEGGVEEEPSSDSTKNQTDASVSKKKVNLFRGCKFERVCQVCEKPGNTVKCRGPCLGTFHVDCARGAETLEGTLQLLKDDDEKPKKRGRKKKIDPSLFKKESPKVKMGTHSKKIYAEEETDSDLEYNSGDVIEANDPHTIMNMIMGNPSAEPTLSIVVEEESEEEEEDFAQNEPVPLVSDTKVNVGDFRCGDCAVLRTPLCFCCGQATDPAGLDNTRYRCSVGHCGKHYHEQCLKSWPQASQGFRKGAVLNLTCPLHVCHTCASDNPRDSIGRFLHEKLVRCIRCPTSYHFGNYCVPAGCEILTATQMICPRHYKPHKKGNTHVNVSWCFICSVGGSLICCDLCPSSIHAECLKIKPPQGSYICEDCESGRFPLYNEVLWVKLGTYRWWPAISLFPSEVPDNVKSRPHSMGEFAVRFLGTKEHYWTHRGRSYVYQEGDSAVQDAKKTNKSHMDGVFEQGIKEAIELHKAHKELRAKMQFQSKPLSLKPPQYTKIKTNKPVGKVKMLECDASNISPCECDPNSLHPCSPESDCLNRILLQECDPNTCPAGERCENQAFEKRLYPALDPYRTDSRGWGLKTLVDIKKGCFVIEYVGEVIDDEEYQRRLQRKHDDKDENYYFLTIDSFRIIDAGPKGNVSRFMNHSCQPNCETQKWTVAGNTRVGLFALHDIAAGTELTFNYNLESKGNEKKPCMCGAVECSGFIGAKKKMPQPEVKAVIPSTKKKRRKPRIRNLIEDICLICNLGKEKGDLITCFNKDCASRFHLTCVGLSSVPPGKWLCCRHQCNLCEKRSTYWCSYCTDSYCLLHLADFLVNDPLHGYICEIHQKNPSSVVDHMKKRDEEKKQKEEERRKRDEAERAQRRSRRERITSDEEILKKKPKTCPEKEDMSETSSEEPNEDKPLQSLSFYPEISPSVMVKNEVEEIVDSSLSSKGEQKNIITKVSLKGKRTPAYKWSGKSESVDKVNCKTPEILESEPQVSSSSHDHVFSKLKIKRKSVELKNNLGIITSKVRFSDKFEMGESDGCVLNELNCFNTSTDVGKDEVPDADPSLDKFILKECEPIDDKETETYENHKDKFSKEQVKKSSLALNSSSPKKKRRKLLATPSQDQIKNYKKPRREMDDDMKDHLSNALEDTVMTFASDDGQESPPLERKKARGQGRGRYRRNLGMVRSRPADSTSKDGFEVSSLDSAVNSRRFHSTSPQCHLKSPVRSRKVTSITSPEVSAPSELFARQRAMGSKVMPPNRRLSSARELAHSKLSGNDFSDKIERAGRGLKILKGRRPSLEPSTTSSKTENLQGGTIMSAGSKRVRTVLTKVEVNEASLEEDANEKVLDNNSSSTPKQPISMLSPPGKIQTPHANNVQSTELGVTPLWNQDFWKICS